MKNEDIYKVCCNCGKHVKYLNNIAEECRKTSEKNGFAPYKNIKNLNVSKWYLGTKIALIHTELSEMMEAIRINDFDGMVGEAIDVLIRTLEYLACLKDVDIDKAIRKKMEINKKRPYKHGGKII